MSYILEALVQAQLERQSHGVPGLYTVQALPRLQPQPRRHWPLALAGVAALSGLLTLAWLQPWYREAPEAAAPIIASATVAAPRKEAGATVVSMAPQDAIPTASVPQLRQDTGEARIAAAKPDQPRRKHHRRWRKGKGGLGGAKIAALPGSRIYGIAELPAELQKVARNISISGFAHSDNPKERTAIINDRALREGEELSGGLRVERIAGDGVIFNLKGYRFRKGRT